MSEKRKQIAFGGCVLLLLGIPLAIYIGLLWMWHSTLTLQSSCEIPMPA